MRKVATIILLMLGVPSAACAQGTPVTLFNAQTGWAVASNSAFGSNGLPIAYNAAFDPATSSAADDIIMEDGTSNTFGALTYTPGSTEQWTETTAPIGWAIANISFASGSYSENVVQSSASLACVRNGNAAEYDLFLGPNSYDKGTNVISAINSAYRTNPALVPSLSQLASLVVTGQLHVNSVSQPIPTATCSVNHVSVVYGFAFVDRKTNQYLSYSLHLASLCLPGPDYISCTHQPLNVANWYQAGMVVGVTDTPTGLTSGLSIVPYGKIPISVPLTSVGMVTFTALDFLPRIEALIQTNPAKLDTNISDWQLSGLTYGTNSWGDSALSTSWQGFNVTASCKNANCS